MPHPFHLDYFFWGTAIIFASLQKFLQTFAAFILFYFTRVNPLTPGRAGSAKRTFGNNYSRILQAKWHFCCPINLSKQWKELKSDTYINQRMSPIRFYPLMSHLFVKELMHPILEMKLESCHRWRTNGILTKFAHQARYGPFIQMSHSMVCLCIYVCLWCGHTAVNWTTCISFVSFFTLLHTNNDAGTSLFNVLHSGCFSWHTANSVKVTKTNYNWRQIHQNNKNKATIMNGPLPAMFHYLAFIY